MLLFRLDIVLLSFAVNFPSSLCLSPALAGSRPLLFMTVYKEMKLDSTTLFSHNTIHRIFGSQFGCLLMHVVPFLLPRLRFPAGIVFILEVEGSFHRRQGTAHFSLGRYHTGLIRSTIPHA